MHIARSLLAAASSLIWPTVVLVVPMGITFSAARVYAESGTAPPAECSSSKVTACADAGAMRACDCGDGVDCACTPAQCSTASGVSEALVCERVSSCKAYAVAPCEGKSAGSACVQPDTAGNPVGSGTCTSLSTGCLAKNDAGSYEATFPLACAAPLNGSDASTTTPSSRSDDGSGCSMPPGRFSNSILLAMPLGLGLAVAFRRKRRRPR